MGGYLKTSKDNKLFKYINLVFYGKSAIVFEYVSIFDHRLWISW